MVEQVPEEFHFKLCWHILLPRALSFIPDQIYILKQDAGSLGCGIRIHRPSEKFTPPAALRIVQESIEAKLFNNRKFDLQIYVLIARVDPLAIWVSWEGFARACLNEHQKGIVNRHNTDVLRIKRFTRMEKTARDFQE
jgi:hypothetical protein